MSMGVPVDVRGSACFFVPGHAITAHMCDVGNKAVAVLK